MGEFAKLKKQLEQYTLNLKKYMCKKMSEYIKSHPELKGFDNDVYFSCHFNESYDTNEFIIEFF
jgi:hypothetical protein